MRSVSATSLSTYEKCPRLWKWKYVYKLLEPYNEAFDIGTLYHDCLQRYYSGQNVDQVTEWLKSEIIKEKTKEEFEKFGLVRSLFEKYIEYPLDKETLETELEFKLKVDFVPVPLYGFIDRIFKEGLVDYKTTSKDYTAKEVDDNVQTDFYSYVYWKLYGRIPEVYFHVVNKKKVNKKDYKPQIFSRTKTQGELLKFEKRIKEFYDNVMAGNFEPKYPDNHWLYRQYT